MKKTHPVIQKLINDRVTLQKRTYHIQVLAEDAKRSGFKKKHAELQTAASQSQSHLEYLAGLISNPSGNANPSTVKERHSEIIAHSEKCNALMEREINEGVLYSASNRTLIKPL